MDYIDIHSHLNFPEFESDRDQVILQMKEKKIGTIIVGTTFEDSKKAVAIAEEHDHIWAIVGCHPIHAAEGFDYEAYKILALHKKVVGIGECGLDYLYKNEYQMEVFDKQISLANELKKPLMLHIRNAYADAYTMVHQKAQVTGNAHFFAGSIADADNFLNIGYTISFTGVVTFTRDYDALVRHIPNHRLMVETDSPYVSPVPHRGERNSPIHIPDIVAKVADIRGETLIHTKSTVLANAQKNFIKIS